MAVTKTAPRRKRSTTAKRKTPVRRRRTTRKKGLLGDLIKPGEAKMGTKAVMSGFAGGVIARFGEKALQSSNMNDEWKAGLLILGGFGMATIAKKPYMGAGMSAIGADRLFDTLGLLNDDFVETDYADPLENLPLMLNENGESMYLQDNGMYLQDNQMYPNAPGAYGVGYYQSGFGGEGYAAPNAY